jgi:uncharacterized protein (TIGR02217 family)
MLESPRFPDRPSFDLTGGPGFSTSIAELDSGVEYANRNWEQARHQYVVSFDARRPEVVNDLLGFFYAVGGMHGYFRLKDWLDYTDHDVGGYVATSAAGVFAVIDATHYQMYKRYTCGAIQHNRKIQKPVSGKVTVTGGSGIAVDSTTGIVTSTGAPTSWSGEFDVPVRFNTDLMRAVILNRNRSFGLITGWQQIELIEVRLV